MVLSASTLHVGESRQQVVLENIPRTRLVMYAGASGKIIAYHAGAKGCTVAGIHARPV